MDWIYLWWRMLLLLVVVVIVDTAKAWFAWFNQVNSNRLLETDNEEASTCLYIILIISFWQTVSHIAVRFQLLILPMEFTRNDISITQTTEISVFQWRYRQYVSIQLLGCRKVWTLRNPECMTDCIFEHGIADFKFSNKVSCCEHAHCNDHLIWQNRSQHC